MQGLMLYFKYGLLAIILFLVIFLLLFITSKKIQSKITYIVNRCFENIEHKKLGIIISALFYIISISILFLPGIIEGHDLSYRLRDIQTIANEFKNGNVFVFIDSSLINGYGYGSYLTYPIFFYYFPALLVYFGLPLTLSYKIWMAINALLIMLIMRFCINKLTNSIFASTCISIIYIMSSYFFTDFYIRAQPGEIFGFLFIPLVITGLYEILYGDIKNGKYLTIGLIGVFLGHVLTCFLSAFFVLIFVLFNVNQLVREKYRLKYLMIYGIFSVVITGFFWIPMFETMASDSLKINNTPVLSSFLKFAVNPLYTILEINYLWTDAYTPPGIGVIFIFMFVFFAKDIFIEKFSFNNKMLCLGLFLLIMSTSIFPWKVLYKILGIMEFPWRFYLFVTISLLFGFSKYISNINNSNRRNKFIIVSIILVLFTYVSLIFNIFIVEPVYTNNIELTEKLGNGGSLSVDTDLDKLIERGDIITSNSKDIKVNYQKLGTNIDVEYTNNNGIDTYLELPLVYYKGYKAIEGDNYLEIVKGENGVVRVNLDQNKNGEIKVYFGFTNIRIISTIVSLTSIVLFIYYIEKRKI